MKINFVSFKTLDLGSKTVLITISVAFISLFLSLARFHGTEAKCFPLSSIGTFGEKINSRTKL